MILIAVDTAVVVPVNVVPLTDDTDFKTRETAVAYNQAGMDLVWNFLTPAGVQTQTAVTPTTAGVYDWTHVGDGMYSIEIPASAGGSINNDTEGYGWFTGFCTGVLPWAGPIITFAPAHVVNGLVTGSDKLQVDAAEWLGTAIATPDTAGYPKTTIKDGTGTGEIDSASGKVSIVAADITSIQSGLATASALDAVDNFVDTEITAIIADLATLLGRLTSTRAGYLDNLTVAQLGIASVGVLDAGGASSFTLPSGQRTNVAAGDAIYIPGKGSRVIDAGYNSSTGAGTTVSAFDSAAATSDPYVVHKLPKSEPFTSADFGTDSITSTALASSAVTEIQSGLATAAALTTVDDFLDTEIAAIKAKTDLIPASPAAVGDIPTAATVADAVWDEALAGHAGAGSAGEALSAAGTAGDPWTTAVPGAYGAGTAGNILGNRLDVGVGTRASQTSVDTVDDLIDTEVAAIKAKTDNLPASPANEATLTTIAGYLDTEIAAIKAQTDLLPSDPADASVVAGLIAAVEAKVDTLLTSDVAYKRATAVTGFMFPMRLTAGTPATGLSITVQISKDGGAFANVTAGSGIATEVSGGWYKIDLSGTEMTADEVALKMTGTGCSQLDVKIRTQS